MLTLWPLIEVWLCLSEISLKRFFFFFSSMVSFFASPAHGLGQLDLTQQPRPVPSHAAHHAGVEIFLYVHAILYSHAAIIWWMILYISFRLRSRDGLDHGSGRLLLAWWKWRRIRPKPWVTVAVVIVKDEDEIGLGMLITM